jgi:hypothetical protein
MPYGVWMYVEITEQDAVGRPPGENQVPVSLGNVVLSFSGLPAAVSQIVIGVKAMHDPDDQTFTERGRFDVVDGSVSIPLDYGDLVSYFGVTHYSIWFQAIGGENWQGLACGQITVSGEMPSGQTVTFSKQICFGTNPVAPPSPPVFNCAAAGGVEFGGLCWFLGGAGLSESAACAALGLTALPAGDPIRGIFWSTRTNAECTTLVRNLGQTAPDLCFGGGTNRCEYFQLFNCSVRRTSLPYNPLTVPDFPADRIVVACQ